jgi:phospholipase/carboxylesterase
MVMTGMYAWFDLSFLQTGISFSYQQAETTRDVLVTFINEVVEAYGADPSQVYLAGFSQGAIMSAAVTLKRPDLIAGVVLMSGSASPELVPADIDREQFRDKPVLIIHGTRDTTLPIHNGRITRDIFAKLPVALTYHEYQMGHEVNMEGLMEVSNWLGKRVERAG